MTELVSIVSQAPRATLRGSTALFGLLRCPHQAFPVSFSSYAQILRAISGSH